MAPPDAEIAIVGGAERVAFASEAAEDDVVVGGANAVDGTADDVGAWDSGAGVDGGKDDAAYDGVAVGDVDRWECLGVDAADAGVAYAVTGEFDVVAGAAVVQFG